MKVEMQVSKIEISVQKLADRQFMITVAKEDHVRIFEVMKVVRKNITLIYVFVYVYIYIYSDGISNP